MPVVFSRYNQIPYVYITYDYEAIYGAPPYTITSFPSTGPGVGTTQDYLIAIDANISLTDDGVLIEMGGNAGTGMAVGVNNGTLRARAFRTTGDSAWGTDTGATEIEADISAYTGSLATYYISIDASAYTMKLYVQPGGRGSTSEKVLLGTDTSDGSTIQAVGANGKGYGQISSTIADLGVDYEVTFTGTINEIRYWGESASYDFSGF